jgi:ketosteroid isomerase-like protein
MRALIPIALIVASIPLDLRAATGQTPDPMALVESERAFARDVAELGIRDGFLAHLAESSVVFQAGPVDGRASYEARPKTESKLAWDPVYAEISAGGDLGWTTGPWTFRPGEGEPVAAAGHYVSLWRMGEDGVRRVELDVGIVHDPVPKPTADPDARLLTEGVNPTGDPVADLEEADRELSADAVEDVAAAYAAHATPDLRVYRMGSLPAIGQSALDLAAARGAFVWEPAGAAASANGDVGYTHGRARSPGADPVADPNGYLRIWRRDGEGTWRLALDLADVPPAP